MIYLLLKYGRIRLILIRMDMNEPVLSHIFFLNLLFIKKKIL